jgi:transposase-like protein
MAVLKRRRISPDDKVRFVILCMRSQRSVAELCREERVSQSSYYQWRAAFIRGGTDRLRRTVRRPQRPKKQCKRPPDKDAERFQFLQRVRVFQKPLAKHCKTTQEKTCQTAL